MISQSQVKSYKILWNVRISVNYLNKIRYEGKSRLLFNFKGSISEYQSIASSAFFNSARSVIGNLHVKFSQMYAVHLLVNS